MHPKTMWFMMMSWMAFLVGMGHYDNAAQIGSIRWTIGFVGGIIFTVAYYKLKSNCLNIIFMFLGFGLLLAGAFGKLTVADPINKIALVGFALGSLLVMIWRGIQLEKKHPKNEKGKY